MHPVIAGGIGGLAATFPMAVAMNIMHRQLPRPQRYPLPPRLVTEVVTTRSGARRQMSEDEKQAATDRAHYGAALGVMASATMSPMGSVPR